MAADSWRAALREFFVDILGSLVPGFMFVFLTAIALGWPLLGLCQVVASIGDIEAFSTDGCIEFAQTAHAEIICFVLVLSYVAGHPLYRQDPKLPDEASVRSPNVRANLAKRDGAVRFPEPEEEGTEVNVEFPYLYLYEFLMCRGLTHLAGLVRWKGSDESTHTRRSKAFINILKMRLEFHCPDRCGTITRNEAHVRLMASVWYMCRSISWLAGTGFCVSVASGLLIYAYAGTQGLAGLVPLPLLSGGIFIGVQLIRRTIERFFHYQRVREVIFVLETAYVASKICPDILADLD